MFIILEIMNLKLDWWVSRSHSSCGTVPLTSHYFVCKTIW